MAKKKFSVDILSQSSIEQLQKKLKAYQKDLQTKVEKFISNLSTHGIETARYNMGAPYGAYVAFTQTVTPTIYGAKAILLATNKGIIHSEWRTQDGIKTADVSPLLMLEFGSGPKSRNPMNIPGVGQGTFPGQTHAFEDGWYYMDLDGKWHYSSGVDANAPMYKAAVNMRKTIVYIAKEVFNK